MTVSKPGTLLAKNTKRAATKGQPGKSGVTKPCHEGPKFDAELNIEERAVRSTNLEGLQATEHQREVESAAFSESTRLGPIKTDGGKGCPIAMCQVSSRRSKKELKHHICNYV